MRGKTVPVVVVLVFVLVVLPVARWCGVTPAELAGILSSTAAFVSAVVVSIRQVERKSRTPKNA
jgi:hypothetical protein